MAKASAQEDCKSEFTGDNDEDLLEDWEQMEDSGLLDKKLEAIEQKLVTSTNQASGYITTIDSPYSIMTPGPQIKILKRPTSSQDFDANGANSRLKPKQPMKTLQQREAEYAQARLRILGEAAAPSPNVTLTPVGNLSNRVTPDAKVVTNGPANIVRCPRGPDGSQGFRPRT